MHQEGRFLGRFQMAMGEVFLLPGGLAWVRCTVIEMKNFLFHPDGVSSFFVVDSYIVLDISMRLNKSLAWLSDPSKFNPFFASASHNWPRPNYQTDGVKRPSLSRIRVADPVSFIFNCNYELLSKHMVGS